MASVWDRLPPLGPSPESPRDFDAQRQHRRNKWIVWTALVPIALAGLTYTGVRVREGFNQSFAGVGNGIGQAVQRGLREMQSGGTAAKAAATVAAPQPPGSLTLAGLNAALPEYQWVGGTTNVLYSANQPIVGITASATHIETAVQNLDGSCSFGLTITSPTDPLTAQDHLAGLGKYYHLVGPGTYWQSVYQPPQCAADQAPTSGWISWPRSLINLTAGS